MRMDQLSSGSRTGPHSRELALLALAAHLTIGEPGVNLVTLHRPC